MNDDINEVTADSASGEMLARARTAGIDTIFDRAERMKPCPIGVEGSCCRMCGMGPCRVPLPKSALETTEEKGQRRGLCGATAETITARNFARMIAAGSAAHSDHARKVTEAFLLTAEGKAAGFTIKDETKLRTLALDFGVETSNRSATEIAQDVGQKALIEFGRQKGELSLLVRAPQKRRELWCTQGVTPRGIDREVVETLHRTHMGVDQDYESLLRQAMRVALADGWGGSMLATELQDVMFGTPAPILSEINLGVLRADMVNVIIHGHEPQLAEVMATAAQDPTLIAYAKEQGASGLNLAGMCCTANEILMRRGVPIAGNFLQQELAVITGAVEAMVVDVQCIMQGLTDIAGCFHTKVITTDPRARIQGAIHIEYDDTRALEVAQEILRVAIGNYPNRPAGALIPPEKTALIAGFSHETLNYLQGGMFRASYQPLNENIISGRIRGVAGVVGCNNARVTHDSIHVQLVKELIGHDVLVLQTGCAAMASAKAGLMVPEAAALAGPGLRSVCEALGIPPVLHLGSCVDNARILMAATAMVKSGGLGSDISDLPAAGAAPEWMSEKALAIGQYFAGSGIFTVFGVSWPTTGSRLVTEHLFKGYEKLYGGSWAFESNPVKMAELMLARIEAKRQALGLDQGSGRVLYDMDMRRGLDGCCGGRRKDMHV
ncbi:MAG: anaerobic carbon-monoxide dehydrogenase catalytic subunit [Dehalococcoidia bacterium]|nr:anaerobic carbon-monoxide dehydrogenase catalytic subunit [Dehalococcoidia bacterium]